MQVPFAATQFHNHTSAGVWTTIFPVNNLNEVIK